MSIGDGGQRGESPRILVTGAAGFIGSHLCERLLDQGCTVWGLDNFDPYYTPALKRRNLAPALRREGMQLVEGDVRDGVLLDGLVDTYPFDVVVHLAAVPGVRASLEAPGRSLDVNVQGTLALLEAMTRHKLRRLVLASSSSVYGEAASLPFCESDTADRPISPYAASKRSAEMLSHAFHDSHGISVHCLRIFTAYGPRQRPDLAIHKFAKLMRAGEPIPVYGDGSSERDYTFVDDVVEGIVLSVKRLLERPDDDPEYQIINLGRGETVRLDELVQAVSEAMGMKGEVERLPAQPGDMPVTHASIDRARELLGWRPRTSLEDGLAAFVQWLEEVEPVASALRGGPQRAMEWSTLQGSGSLSPEAPTQTGS